VSFPGAGPGGRRVGRSADPQFFSQLNVAPQNGILHKHFFVLWWIQGRVPAPM